MDINAFYEKDDAVRAVRTLRLLAKHDISRWALTGGTAIELHLHQMGAQPCVRPLHELDFIAARFACIPPSLGAVVLSRHVHPHAPQQKPCCRPWTLTLQ
jgi:hypothetical protein